MIEYFFILQVLIVSCLGSYVYVITFIQDLNKYFLISHCLLGAFLSTGITLMIYDLTHRKMLCLGLALTLGSLGHSWTSKFAKRFLDKKFNKSK